MKSSRREFIRISALGLGGLAIGAGTLRWAKGSSLATRLTAMDRDTLSRTPTYCEVCFWKCAGWAYSDGSGDIKKVIGHPEDPHCNGRLCPRGTGGVGMFHDKDRLKRPLIRVEDNGKQTFREASWEEALDLVTQRLREIADRHGPESIALFNHGSAGTHFSHLLKAMGSANIVAPSFAQCRGPREVGFALTFGSGLGSPEPLDIRDARCMVLIGSHLGENMHNSQVQEMSDAIDNGIQLITVDPRFSTVASKSRYWLPIKPATDMALLLAWMHVLINEEWYDKEYISRYASGFEELKRHVQPFTPEWAYGITTIEPHLIRETARTMADAAPSVIIHPGRHVTWYGDDTQRSRAIAILNALLGSYGRRGGIYFKDNVSVPDFPHPPYPQPSWTWRDTHNGRFPFAGLAVANALIEASIPSPENTHRIHAWIVAGTNLPLTMPDKKQWSTAMEALDFMLVVDTMPMEITGYADVIFPECTYLERYDELRDSPQRDPWIALRMPAVAPLYDTKPAWWMARELGHRLGLSDFFDYEDYTEVLDWQLKELGSSLEEMQRLGVKKMDRQARSLYLEKDEDYEFPTDSGKIELYSAELAATGFDPMPVYTPHPEPPEGFYRLNYGRAPMHTFSRTANNPNLTDLMEENNLWVNPKVAKVWDIQNGQYVWLKNQDEVISSFPVKVRITERIRWDSVYIVHGFGHSNKWLTRAFGKGINDSELITRVMLDPLMGGTGMRGNFVTFVTENPGKEVEA